MIFLQLLFFQNRGFFSIFYSRIQEGGLFAMTLIVICLFIMLFLIVQASRKIKSPYLLFKKQISLINQIALLALVIAFFNQILGLIQVFDAFESLDNISPQLMGGGIKITLLSPLFGGFVFLIGRIATFILSWIRKDDSVNTAAL